ncbi:MAG: hypothetical protein ABSF49_06100 [Roseiarcus sp.]|jgi:hypothetical protein|uniref:YXWGXW repeat-containing protein n=1 Tax=Roseiarcus sp. TaxID=1969460 RepID=UPI003C1370D6
MRHLRPLLLSTFLGAGVLAAQVAPVFAQTCACPPVQGDLGAPATTGGADVAVYADEAPPPLPDYDQPPIPADGDMWTPGYWSWNGYEYFWVPGTWVEPPQPGFLWTPGYWAFVGGVYAFHRGYWGEHVGFYGGVYYGFGYGGAGYEGGHWDNGRFFYNRSVTNIGRVNIVNVYNQQVTINERTRVSFNGGPNGVDAKPTAAELEAAKDKHLAPTSDQLRNARVAGRTESAFVSANKGKPRIAATAKPGEFKGDAVVPAKAAGGPLKPTTGATPQPTKGQLEEKKPGEPTPEATKAKPEKKLEQPKAEPTKVEPTPGETKANPENKLDRPKTEPTQLETPKPEPTKAAPEMKIERPKPEPTKIAPERKIEQPRPEPMRSPPSAAPRGKPEAGCGRPGEPVCPK